MVRGLEDLEEELNKVNPVRNSSRALNPAGIIIKSNPVAEQQGIISNGVKKESQGQLCAMLKEKNLRYC
jgi:hypothetical protein